MSIYHTYYDETGDPQRGGNVQLVGLFGWHGMWDKFNHDWLVVLNSVPRIRYWHTVSAHTGRLYGIDGAELDREAREDKELKLAEVLAKYARQMASIEVDLQMKDWAELVDGKVKAKKLRKKSPPEFEDYLEHPWFIAMRRALAVSIPLARQSNALHFPQDPFVVWNVFEDNDLLDMQIHMQISLAMLRKSMSPEARQHVGPVVFLPGKGPLGFTTLQAVDLFAWHLNRMKQTGEETREWGLMGEIPRNELPVTRKILKQMVEDLNSSERIEM